MRLFRSGFVDLNAQRGQLQTPDFLIESTWSGVMGTMSWAGDGGIMMKNALLYQ